MDFLADRNSGATTKEIREALRHVRRSEVLPHSVRATLYRHMDGTHAKLFVRLGRGRYGLRK
ncbi:MAG TPA: hypothetical protein VFV03_01560 [Solirubrobacteraceae bacterium]|nr:hypothetical protein [Solirubrobacteraceae bacterium]